MMRFIKICILLFCLQLMGFVINAASQRLEFNTTMSHSKPLLFMENIGQLADEKGQLLPEISYYIKKENISIYCKKDRIAFVFQKGGLHSIKADEMLKHDKNTDSETDSSIEFERVEMQFLNSNPNVQISAAGRQSYYENYYLAHCPAGITAGSFKTLTYRNIYPFTDLVLDCNDKGLEYSFIVRPGGDVKNIEIQWNGVKVNNVVLYTDPEYYGIAGLNHSSKLGFIKERDVHAALASKEPVRCQYIHYHNFPHYGFEVDPYPKEETLIIDPQLIWGTYFGGSGTESCSTLGILPNGSPVVAGNTNSTAAIATTGAYQTSYAGSKTTSQTGDAFVAAFSAAGSRLWSTYYGGNDDDQANAMAIDRSSNIIITGSTRSSTGIASSGAFQTSFGGYIGIYRGGDAFVASFTSKGARNWSTYFGGNDNEEGWEITTDTAGNIYAGGYGGSKGLATSGAYMTTPPAGATGSFVVKFSNTGARQWSSYLDGFGAQAAFVTDRSGNLFMSGKTYSNGLATSGAYQTSLKGSNADVCLAKFTSSGSLLWFTYYGTYYDEVSDGLSIDTANNLYVSGYSDSWSGMATPGAFQTYVDSSLGGVHLHTGFITKFNSSGFPQWCTYLGNHGSIIYTSSLDKDGNILAGGGGFDSTYCTPGAYKRTKNPNPIFDMYIGKISANGKKLLWGTEYGGDSNDIVNSIKGDRNGNVYAAGYSWSGHGISTSKAYQRVYAGYGDGVLARFGRLRLDAGADSAFHKGSFACAGNDSISLRIRNYGTDEIDSISVYVLLKGVLQKPVRFKGHLLPDSAAIINYPIANWPAGIDSITAFTYSPNGGNDSVSYNDSTHYTLKIWPLPVPKPGKAQAVCKSGTVSIGDVKTKGYSYSWKSIPAGYSSASAGNTVSLSATTTYYVTQKNDSTGCYATDSVKMTVNPLPIAHAGHDTLFCASGTATLGAPSIAGHTYAWTSVPAGFTSTASTVKIPVTSSGTYYVKETITATGCSATDTAVVSVITLPPPRVGIPRSVCKGSPTVIGDSAEKGHTYLWSSVPAGFSSSLSMVTVKPDTATYYYLTDSFTGCKTSNSVRIGTYPLPVPIVGPPATLCPNFPWVVGGLLKSGHTYAWTSNPPGFSSTDPRPGITVTQTTTYYLTETITATGCSAKDSVTISMYTPPVVHFGKHPYAVCHGTPVTLGDTAKNLRYTYYWTSIPYSENGTTQIFTATPQKTTLYLLLAKDTVTRCSGSDTATVVVYPLMDTIISGQANICADKAVAFSINDSFVTGGWQWTVNKGNIEAGQGTENVTVKLAAGMDTLRVTRTDKFGCRQTDSTVIPARPTPDAHFTVTKDSINYIFNDADSSGQYYKWTFGDGETGYSHSIRHIYKTDKDTQLSVSLYVANAFGCTAEYDTMLKVKALPKQGPEVLVFPNPLTENSVIQLDLAQAANVQIAVFDALGRLIAKPADGQASAGLHSYGISPRHYRLASAAYFIRISIGDKTFVQPVVYAGQD